MMSDKPQRTDEPESPAGEEHHAVRTPPQQRRYADLVHYGAWAAMVVMVVTYALYVSGAVRPQVPVTELHEHWSMPAEQYVAATGVPTGWGWLRLIGKGDMLNLAGISLMGMLTVVALLALIPAYARKGDRLYLGIVCLQIAVLASAASGLLSMVGQ